MHKLMLFLSRPSAVGVADFRSAIEAQLSAISASFLKIRYSIADDDVAPAKPLAIVSSAHPKDAVVSLLSDNQPDSQAVVRLFESIASVVQVYEVEERVPLLHEGKPGRVEGMCQIALLKRPAHLTCKQWLGIWLNSHTQIAIDTQSTFSYRQNIVETVFPAAAVPAYDAIVEEQFPAAAMSDRSVFFDAPGDEARYKANEKAMVDSVVRFIDFAAFECVPMSEYRLK